MVNLEKGFCKNIDSIYKEETLYFAKALFLIYSFRNRYDKRRAFGILGSHFNSSRMF